MEIRVKQNEILIFFIDLNKKLNQIQFIFIN